MGLSVLMFLAALAAAQAPSAQDKPTSPATAEKPICHRTAVIGSLVPTKRECHTRAEWAAMARAGNDAARDIIDHDRGGGGSPP